MSAATVLRDMVGDEMMQRICDTFGGEHIYLPETPPGRSRLILEQFNAEISMSASVHSAYETVAKEFDVSPRTVQRVVCAG